MSENIKLKRNHFTLVDGYFYFFDDETNVLFQKTADSSTSFSFPLDTLLNNEVYSLEYDGVNFWTLEQASTESLMIKRWEIENYICKQKQVINLEAGFGHKYNAEAFTVEHYHTTITGAVTAGDTRLEVAEYWDKVSSGMTITIGPNTDGFKETLNIQGWEDGAILLADEVQYDYLSNTKISFYTNIWLFNNFDGDDATSAALYKINAYTGGYVTRYPGDEYKNIKAATFYKITAFDSYGPIDTLLFVKASNILFIDISSSGSALPYYGSMVIDNIADDDKTVLEVYDLAVEGNTIYKLQLKANYFGNTETYTLANYSAATQLSMVTSMSLIVDPNIVAANGHSSVSIRARVKDQFYQPVAGRLVYFGHDDTSGGDITGGNPVNTDVNGEAGTTYTAGTEAREVKLTATIDQV